MPQAILVKYIGPTNTKPSRLIASCDAGCLTLSFAEASEREGNKSMAGIAVYAQAAIALARKLGWSGRLVGGSLPGNNGCCFVWCDDVQAGGCSYRVIDFSVGAGEDDDAGDAGEATS